MAHAVDAPMPDAAQNRRTTRVPSFPELVWAPHAADVSPAEYDDLRAAFEAQNGPIVQEWRSRRGPSGVAVTSPRTTALRGAVAAQRVGAQLHRATDWETSRFPRVGAALQSADGLAIRCREILRGTAQLVALTHVFGAVVALLGFVEEACERLDRPQEDAEAAAAERAQLDADLAAAISAFQTSLATADAYYRSAAARTTQIFYFWGMTVGALAIAVLTSAVAVVVDTLLASADISPDPKTFALMITAVSAGALGAVVSAMWRISSGDFYADHEAGSMHARTIGAFRPFIGAVFGLGLYTALRAGFLPTLDDQATDFYLAAFLAFLGGFSERLAPDVFAKAEDKVGSAAAARPTDR